MNDSLYWYAIIYISQMQSVIKLKLLTTITYACK